MCIRDRSLGEGFPVCWDSPVREEIQNQVLYQPYELPSPTGVKPVEAGAFLRLLQVKLSLISSQQEYEEVLC